MRLSASLLLTALGMVPALAFTSFGRSFVSSRALGPSFTPHQYRTLFQMSSSEASVVPIVITGNNVEVTPALMEYVNSKLDRVIGKLASGGAIQSCDVHLSVNRNPKVKDAHNAEVVTKMKGLTIRCAQDTPDMYASIDFVADRLKRKLRKFKERREEGHHKGVHIGENIFNVLNEMEEDLSDAPADEEDDFIDPESAKITKIKSFDLSTPMSMNEAIFALDYIDHDFYVFRDAETKEISVVYKRNAGGIGFIQPSE